MSDDIKENKDEKKEVKGKGKKDDIVAKLQASLDECEAKYKRALADYQNLVARTREERADWIRTANSDLILRILPVVDTLELAKRHSEDQTLGVTLQQFLDVLAQEGVIRVETAGKQFDPSVMECIETVGDGDEVVEEVRTGYTMHGRLLRPAQVKVGSSHK